MSSTPTTTTATPAMRQYLEAKRQYRDAIVFFRMGDFYEMFYEDALVASRALELTLTSRSKDAGGNGIPMCGVPFHAADGYLTRLVKKGFRVAICEQVEDPRKAKGLVRREVVRVVSPGTLTDATYLEAREPAFLMAIVPGRGGKVTPDRFVPLAAELEGIRGVTLYYGLAGTDSLVAEYRDVVVKDRPADQVRAVFRELVAGPTGNRVALFPDGTELLNAYLSPRGTLFLDWSHALTQGFHGGSGRERLLLGSIVRTAADNFPDVDEVSILVDGNPVETIGGHYDALAPFAVSEWR